MDNVAGEEKRWTDTVTYNLEELLLTEDDAENRES